MNTKQPPTIRSRLAMLVTACILPGAMLSIFWNIHNYHREREQVVKQSIATAHAVATAVEKDVSGIESSLTALASSPYLASQDLSAFYAQAKSILKDHVGVEIALADANGEQQFNTLWAFGEPLSTHSDPDLWSKVFETGRPVISNLFTTDIRPRPLVAVGVPVRISDKIEYNLSAGISPQHLSDILLQQNLPNDWIATIVDGHGRVIARTHDMQRFVGHQIDAPLLQHIEATNEDSLEHDLPDGTPAVSVFSRSALSNWTVLISIPTSSMNAELINSIWWMLVITAVLLASSLTLASLLGKRIANALHELTGPALALGFGREVDVPPIALLEADEVGKALVKASRLLQQVQHDASHDPLTGLANRALFNDLVKQEIAVCQRTRMNLSVLYVDLDGFKQINDEYGHAMGDELLRAVAHRLQSSIRESDVAARLGGDEFAVILVHASLASAALVADKLVEALATPYYIDYTQLHVSASIGVAGYPESGDRIETLLLRADQAMYDAKNAGKCAYSLASLAT